LFIVENDKFFLVLILEFLFAVSVAAIVGSLLKRTCVVTPLPNNSARIRGEPTSEELGRVKPNKFQNSLLLSHFLFLALFFSL
jgi:hypothetical protein